MVEDAECSIDHCLVLLLLRRNQIQTLRVVLIRAKVEELDQMS